MEEEKKEEEGKEESRTYRLYRILARCYIDLQQLRIAVESRIRKLKEHKVDPKDPIFKILKKYRATLHKEEKDYLNAAKPYIVESPLWDWANRVKGLGSTGALMFLGHIDPYKAATAGQAKKHLGLIPGVELKSGKKAEYDPLGKGRVWFATQRVLMLKDPYYTGFYRAKKTYYLETKGWDRYIKDPRVCPDYEDCLRRLKAKAARLHRELRQMPCRRHVDDRAKKWLAGTLVAHAWELLRRAEGLPVPLHHNHIPPKPEDEYEARKILDELSRKIIKGERHPRWESEEDPDEERAKKKKGTS